MTTGGKGSKPRPFSVTQEEYDKRWDAIFAKDIPNDKERDSYQDLLSTEDCLSDALDKVLEGR